MATREVAYELVMSPDYRKTRTWRVTVGGELIGTVAPFYVGTATRRWGAYTAGRVRLLNHSNTGMSHAGSYRTVNDAAGRVIADYERRKRRP